MARTTMMVAFLLAFSKILGFVREQIIAMFFGATGKTDSYMVALQIPTLVTGMFSGPISSAFLPVFAAYIARGEKDKASQVASSVSVLSMGAVIAVSLMALLPAPALVRFVTPGFTGERFEDAVRLTRMFLPAMFLPLGSALFKAILNSYGEFFAPAAAPVIQNLVIIAATACLAPVAGINALAIGTVVGYFANLVVHLGPLRKSRALTSFKVSLDEGTRKVLKLSVPLAFGFLFSQVYQLVDNNLASRLAEGSIAALRFADRVRQVPLGLFVTAVVTVIAPSLSQMWARKDKKGFAETFENGLRYTEFICIPAALGLSILARPLVKLLLERGAFTSSATTVTAYALMAYAPGLVALAASQIVTIAFYSIQDTATPVYIGITVALLNALLDIMLVKPLGHVGLAMANTVAACVAAVGGTWLLGKRVDGLVTDRLWQAGLKVLTASLAMGAAAWFTARLTQFGHPGRPFVQDAVSGIIVIGIALLVYAGAAFLLKCDEMSFVLKRTKKDLNKPEE